MIFCVIEMVATVLECHQISKWFGEGKRRVVALNGTSFSLFRGEITLLMGPSGSGKSSLIAALSGLQAPSSGKVIGPDGDIWAKSSRKITKFRRKYCGFVFQNVGLFPALSAIEQIVLPLIFIGLSPSEAKRRAIETLEWVGLENQMKSKPGEMSGGENQRVAIARMLAKRPQLVFCDEPTSALDRENGAIVVELLRRAAVERNAMILCATHDERILPYADRILFLEDGELKKDTRNVELLN